MYKIFGHFISKNLVLLGFAELLILLVFIYIGVSFQLLLFQATDTTINILQSKVLTMALISSVIMFTAMMIMGLYQRDRSLKILLRLSMSFVLGFVLLTVVYNLFPEMFVGKNNFVIALTSAFIGIILCRFIYYKFINLYHRILVLGVGQRALQIQNLLHDSDHRVVLIIGYIDVDNGSCLIDPASVLKVDSTLLELTRTYAIDEIVVAPDDRRNCLPFHDLLQCKLSGIRISEDSSFHERQLGKLTIDSLKPSNIFYSDGFSQTTVNKLGKRLFDIILSSLLLIMTLPIMLLTVIAILIESRGQGKVIYKQVRVGHNGKLFEVYKFRSMQENAEADGKVQWATVDDKRVTRVGRQIRAARIDELPQLFNVLNGDMSFVGPRPERPEFVNQLNDVISYYGLRDNVKPGITGWAQICYPYGASVDDAREKLQYDLYYLKNYSLFLDLMIVFQTVQVVLFRKGSR